MTEPTHPDEGSAAARAVPALIIVVACGGVDAIRFWRGERAPHYAWRRPAAA